MGWPADSRPFDAEPNPPGEAPILGAGEVLAGRFRIRRLLGQGGTGEVYQAEDIVLRTALALKVLRPEVATDRMLERFRREVLLARRVTHPDVCRVFDFYEDTLRKTGRSVQVRFLTMELLHGETLTTLLRRRGRLTTEEALPLARDMAEALSAAHRAGVVHRDFKSANVMLVPRAGGSTRAVVTDFGLARVLEVEETSSSGESGPLVGTCAYMSPEQVEGGVVGTPADIYAFGVVLFEMITGRKPFVGETALATALKRVREEPPRPSLYSPDLDPRWEAAILRCLARDPHVRFRGADSVVEALATSEWPSTPPAAARGHRRLLATGAAVVAIVLGLTAGARLHWSFALPPAPPRGEEAASDGAPGVPTRPAVALLGFKNLSGRADTAWLSTALAEMLRTELSVGGRFRTIAGENVARMKIELALSDTDTLAKDTLARVRSNVGADLVVLGSYLDLGQESGGRIRLDLRVQDARTGETASALTETGSESEIFDLVNRLGEGLRDDLGAGRERTGLDVGIRGLPAGREALRLYYEGLAALRVLDAATASRTLQRAVAIAPESPMVRAALAEAWIALGSDGKARAEAQRAFAFSARLPDEERMWVEGRYWETAQDWSAAVRTYARLWQAFPDNLEYGLRLASAQSAAGHPHDAVATIAGLRRLGGLSAQDPRIDLAEADASEALSDFDRMRGLAQSAAAKGARQQARLLIARARLREAKALQHTGDTRQAAERFEEAERFFAATGDLANVAWTHLWLGLMRWSEGEPEEARLLYTRALDAFEKLGHSRGRAGALNALAIVHWKQGDFARARPLWEESLSVFREIDDKTSIARLLNNLAVIAQSEGDLDHAAVLCQESLAIERAVGDKRGMAFTLANVAGINGERGDLRAAEKQYEEALALTESIRLKSTVAMNLHRLSELRLWMGDLARARKGHERALALRTEMSQKLFVAESRLALGQLALEEGRNAEAEAAARQSIEEFRREKAAADEAMGHALLASALAAQGRWAASRDEGQRARRGSENSHNQLVRLTVRIATARLDAPGIPGARPQRGRRALEQVIAEARKGGRRGVELEARLALCDHGVRGGEPSAAASASGLEREAAAHGFGLIARKAAALAAEGR